MNLVDGESVGRFEFKFLRARSKSLFEMGGFFPICFRYPEYSNRGAWKDKDTKEIGRIYQRSSINLLSFSLFIFILIWLNFSNAISFFNINPEYLNGKWVFFIMGLVTIIEMGTGVNSQIIGTSTYWRFELWTSLLLTAMIIPLSYTLTVKFGILGPALSNLISLLS